MAAAPRSARVPLRRRLAAWRELHAFGLVSGLGRVLTAGQPIYEARGCEHCRGTGYQGRTGIHELLVVDEAMRSAILQGLDASALHAIATRAGMHSLYEDGLRKVAAGVTSLDELLRVTQDQGDA